MHRSTILVEAPAGTLFNLGLTTVGNNSGGASSNSIFANFITLSSPAQLKSISLYTTSAAGNARLGMYDASGTGGQPGNLIFDSGTIPVTTGLGWTTATLSSPIPVPVGNYWIVFLMDTTAGTLYYNTSGGLNIGYSNPQGLSTFGPLPNPYSVPGTSWALLFNDWWSLYATFLG